MKVLILGSDGYIGYPLSIKLLRQGHTVGGVDNYVRRDRVAEIGSQSLTPILSATKRENYLRALFENYRGSQNISLGTDIPKLLRYLLREFKPDAIVHLAEQPSAPWSMQDATCAEITQQENVIGTLHLLWAIHQECPEAHLVKLGTMGEYGTPACDIPEGNIPEECLGSLVHSNWGDRDCPMKGLLFPRQAGSFYHLSKVHDTMNIHFACRNWGLRSTDIMQGVVFGLSESPHEEELTRFDYDEYFGTVINRFCAQAIIEHPLTIYGEGGQTRGFIPLKDSLQCLTIAINNPPSLGEYRTFNQFENIYSVDELAKIVVSCAYNLGLKVAIEHISNPRKEAEQHYYNPTHQKLFDLGYVPTTDIRSEITTLIRQILPYRARINKEIFMPKTNWR